MIQRIIDIWPSLVSYPDREQDQEQSQASQIILQSKQDLNNHYWSRIVSMQEYIPEDQ